MNHPEPLSKKLTNTIYEHFKEAATVPGEVEIYETLAALELTKTVTLGALFNAMQDKRAAQGIGNTADNSGIIKASTPS